MDLLEYQGKQVFRKHGVPVPEGQPAASVEEAVDAADGIGFPVAIKAQVQIGGRGKAGGIKLARDSREAEEHAKAILGMDIRGLNVRELYVERASEIDEEYYAAIVFDRSAKKPMAMLSRMGGRRSRRWRRRTPRRCAWCTSTRWWVSGLPWAATGLRVGDRGQRDSAGRRAAGEALRRVRGGGRDAGRGKPAARDEGSPGGGAGR